MFTSEQIKELQQNKNIKKCSANSITYKTAFKLKAIKQYFDEGYSPRMIFERADFYINVIGVSRAKDSLLRWRKKYGRKGEKGLKEDDRGKSGGRKKKMRFKNDKEKIGYLETKIKYLDAENDFLAKLRGLKRE